MALSVFENGFTREATQTVAGTNIRQLMKFVNLSLLTRNTDTGRYRMHELLRQYAVEQLHLTGQEKVITAKHARYYADLVQSIYPDLQNGQLKAIEVGFTEFENIKAAWYWDIENGNCDIIADIADGFKIWGRITNRPLELIDMAQAAYARFAESDLSNAARSKLETIKLQVEVFFLRDFETAISRFDTILNCLKADDDKVEIAVHYGIRTIVMLFAGQYDLSEQYARDYFEMAQASAQLGFIVLVIKSELESGIKWYTKARDMAAAIGNPIVHALASYNLSEIYYLQKDFDKAKQYVEEAFPLAIAAKNGQLIVLIHDIKAALYYTKGDLMPAETILDEAVQYAEKSGRGDVKGIAYHLLMKFYFRFGRYDDVLKLIDYLELNHFNERQPPFVRAQFGAIEGVVYWITGKYDKAIPLIEDAAYRLAKGTQPGIYYPALFGMALIWQSEGNAKRALELLSLMRHSKHWTNFSDDHAVVQLLDQTLHEKFSDDEYTKIASHGATQDYQKVVMTLHAELAPKFE